MDTMAVHSSQITQPAVRNTRSGISRDVHRLSARGCHLCRSATVPAVRRPTSPPLNRPETLTANAVLVMFAGSLWAARQLAEKLDLGD
jgi:hypothetical protein